MIRPTVGALVGLLALTAPSVLAAQATPPEALTGAGIHAPSRVRSPSGRPGPDYWQQRADYRIDATLDPATATLRGSERITYRNNSPDALPELWLQVEQNICAPGSVTSTLDQPPLVFLSSSFDFSCGGFVGGDSLLSVAVNGRPVRPVLAGTTMRLDLPAPLAHGGVALIDIRWTFTVPPFGAGRMGHDGPLFELGQWYPRMVVYDDVTGWNTEPYIGAGEFYLEYGAFDVAIHVPANYTVAATGVLQNPVEALTATQRARILRARSSDTAIAIITKEEAERTTATPRGARTWRYHADSVRDFAFATAPNFRWDASNYDGVQINTYYRPGATLWPEANRMARSAVKHYSEQWLKYPYPHASAIEGPIEGMEYPMMTFDPSGPVRTDLQWVVAHELGHQWFPMLVGSNERLFPWMDEGFNTFIDLQNAAEYWHGTPYGDTIEVHPLHLYDEHALTGSEQPLITPPVQVRDLFWTGYQKPALMMRTLREFVLGRPRFDDAFRAYAAAWEFKHPTPGDFFRMMRDRTGMDLSWYWRDWVYTTNRPDQGVEAIVNGDSGSSVVLVNKGTMQLPVFLKVTYADNTTESVTLPVEMWNQGPRFTWRARNGKQVVRAEVDPQGLLPDADRSNNARTAG
ncbi:MAG TPA: M1 family metallopeptidase [Gemmatimonadales bacterium]|nr:M1 family metallopeptidase [Gemmatimonadales bacterium]